MWTRRKWCNRLLGTLGVWTLAPIEALASADRPLFIERVLARFPAPESNRELCYRADVTIQILKVPLFRRRGVGGAVASVREYRREAEQALGISFLAGSNPSEAGGVNRFGYIEEVVVEHQSVPLEAAYFGVMTSSPEDNFESARGALGESSKTQAYYAGIDGYLKGSKSVSTEAAFRSSGAYTWGSHPPLNELMKNALRDNGSQVKEKAEADARWEIPVTFLYAVAKSLRQQGGRQTLRYIYHGHEFTLETWEQPDPVAGKDFVQRNLVKRAEDVIRVEGRSKQMDANKRAAFTLWKDQQDRSGLPLRFEFRPKSFLKLSFEADPAVKPPVTASWRREVAAPRGE
ncbi:MAG: hypothetical protein KIT83_10965 [Bryobacterales bacterium]|nr:hypothetical protein [Bryobacterales bacterium]